MLMIRAAFSLSNCTSLLQETLKSYVSPCSIINTSSGGILVKTVDAQNKTLNASWLSHESWKTSGGYLFRLYEGTTYVHWLML